MREKQGEAAKPSKAKKVFGWVLNILFFCFFLLCIFALFVSVAVKREADGAMRLFGYEMRIVVSPSMEKCDATDVSGFEIKDIPVKSLVFIQTVPQEKSAAEEWYASLKIGDVLTFRYVYVNQETITHRLVEITPKQTGGYILVLEGDNKDSEEGVLQQTIDTSLQDSPNYVIGKVTGTSYVLGLLVTAVKSPVGIVCIVIVPSLIIIVMEIVRIAGILSDRKRQILQEQQKQKDDEIAELKRQLAAVQMGAEQKTAVSDNLSEENQNNKEE